MPKFMFSFLLFFCISTSSRLCVLSPLPETVRVYLPASTVSVYIPFSSVAAVTFCTPLSTAATVTFAAGTPAQVIFPVTVPVVTVLVIFSKLIVTASPSVTVVGCPSIAV